MSLEIKTNGIVLHEMPIGDYDKRLIILAKDLGKITVFAKNSRKANSKFLAGSQIFSYGEYLLYKGKNSYNINNLNLINSFYNIRHNIEDLTWGLYLLEFVEHVTEENNSNNSLMELLLKALMEIEKKRIDTELVIEIFEIKALSILGYTPWVENCLKCGNEEAYAFSYTDGGILCLKCKKELPYLINLSKGCIYTIDYIIKTNIKNLFKFKLENKILDELKLVSESLIKYNLNKKFKSLDFFNKI